MPKRYGHYLRVLHWCMDQAVTGELAKMELTAAQGPILGFLVRRQLPPCQRDVEEEFQLSHPTVSGLLSRLEKKGFIEFRPDEADRRCKRIYVLDKGRECHDRVIQTIRATEERMLGDFTDAEEVQFEALLKRAITNMGGSLCCPRPKEESEEND